VAHVSAGALGRGRRRRLLHNGSVNAPGAGDLLHAVRAGSRELTGAGVGLDAESRCWVHGPSGAAPH
jgi:hypothetical protein